MVSGGGLVGRVVTVSRLRSTVVLITDPSSNVGVTLVTANEKAVAEGNGPGKPLRLNFLDAKSQVGDGDKVVLQFYPPGAEERLAQLETRYRGRTPGEIRVTRFAVVPSGSGYDFKVIAQEALR